jgi:hypothetical protein
MTKTCPAISIGQRPAFATRCGLIMLYGTSRPVAYIRHVCRLLESLELQSLLSVASVVELTAVIRGIVALQLNWPVAEYIALVSRNSPVVTFCWQSSLNML